MWIHGIARQSCTCLGFAKPEKKLIGEAGIFVDLWRQRPDVQFVPVYLANLNRVLPKGEVLPVPFISRVAFGRPLQPAPDESKETFLREAREAVCALQHA